MLIAVATNERDSVKFSRYKNIFFSVYVKGGRTPRTIVDGILY